MARHTDKLKNIAVKKLEQEDKKRAKEMAAAGRGNNKRKAGSGGSTYGGESGVFMSLNSSSLDDGPNKAPKNRPGQKQRKAKAMAIENAKNKTRSPPSRTSASAAKDKVKESFNWRKPKPKPKASQNNKPSFSGASISPKLDKDLHPSWKAKDTAKSKGGIVAFTGNKIVFD